MEPLKDFPTNASVCGYQRVEIKSNFAPVLALVEAAKRCDKENAMIHLIQFIKPSSIFAE